MERDSNVWATLKKLLTKSRFYWLLLGVIVMGYVFLIPFKSLCVYYLGDEFDVEIIDVKKSKGSRRTLYSIYFYYEGKKCESEGFVRDEYNLISVGDVVKMRKCKYIDEFLASCSCTWLNVVSCIIFLLCMYSVISQLVELYNKSKGTSKDTGKILKKCKNGKIIRIK